jgi:transcriptional regulator with XRE-family HTH domain
VFRETVRDIRKRRGLRIADVAERAGLSRSALTRIENGERGISLDEAFALCASLGASPLALLSQDNSPVEVAPGEFIDGAMFRQWLRGNAWVRPDDLDYIPAEVDPESWARRVDTSLKQVIRRNQAAP